MRILSVWINHGIELGQLRPDNLHQWLMFHWTMIVSVEANEIRVFAWMCPRGLYRKCREIRLLAPTPTQVADLWRLSALVIAFSLMQIPGYPHFGAPGPGGFVIMKAVSEKNSGMTGQGWCMIILPPTQKKSCHMPFLKHISHFATNFVEGGGLYQNWDAPETGMWLPARGPLTCSLHWAWLLQEKMQGELGCQGPMAEDDSRRSLEKA